MPNLLEYTSAFQRWMNQFNQVQATEETLLDYSYANARIDQLILALDILWPKFVRKEQYILREDAIPPNWALFKQQAAEADWSVRNVEYVINHLRLSERFMNDPDIDHIEPQLLSNLAHAIVELWRARLLNLFPNESFHVGVEDGDSDPEIYVYR